jgi:ATP-binding cassette, subfamily B, bacterial
METSTRYIRAAATVVRLAWRTDRWRTVANSAIVAVSQASAVLVALLARALLDAVLAGNTHDAWAAGITATVVMLVSFLGYVVGYDLVRLPLVEEVAVAADATMIEVFGASTTLDVHDDPALLDDREFVRSHRRDLGESLEDLAEWLCVALQLAATIAILATIDARAVLLPLFAIPSVLAARHADTIRQRAAASAAPDQRHVRHVEELMSSPGPASEVRVFGLGPTLLGRHAAAWNAASTVITRADARATVEATVGWIAFVLGYAGVIISIVHRAAIGHVSPGDVVLALALSAQVSNQVQGVLRNGHYLLLDLRVADAFRRIAAGAQAHVGGSAAPPNGLRDGIRLESVGYRYRGARVEAVSGVTLDLPAGTTVALVGENGAGKSTLVKLLAGLYKPTSGRILVDGVDLSTMDPFQWQARVGGAFQDFAKFELVARESVGIGHLPDVSDPGAVEKALTDVGAGHLPDVLPRGLDTPLGESFPDGSLLSGGQWQAIALGRSAMRQDPLLLLLDEPTASLDPRAEHRVFERFSAIAARASRVSGCVTVLVTHRFAAAPTADLIVFLDGGHVVERGTHAQLMAKNGRYAELYRLQRRAYVD